MRWLKVVTDPVQFSASSWGLVAPRSSKITWVSVTFRMESISADSAGDKLRRTR